MSVPWIENRNSKIEEKEQKYRNIVQGLKVDNPGYSVKQLTFKVDCLGGYSKDLINSMKELELTKHEIDSIIPGIQNILVTEANSVINHFKILTMTVRLFFLLFYSLYGRVFVNAFLPNIYFAL